MKKGIAAILSGSKIVTALLVRRKICPGMSFYRHGSHSNNTHNIGVSGDILMSLATGVCFDLDAATCGKKYPSDLFKPTEATFGGETRFFKRISQGNGSSGNDGLNTYKMRLPILKIEKNEETYQPDAKRRALGKTDDNKPVPSTNKKPLFVSSESERRTKQMSQHRWITLLTNHCGLLCNSPQLTTFLGEKPNLEARYLATGSTQYIEDQSAGDVIDWFLNRHEMTRSDMPNVKEEDDADDSDDEYVESDDDEESGDSKDNDKAPQGCSDVDHWLRRIHWIGNSIYFCFPCSHTANQINAIIRKNRGDWCYVMIHHEYNGGN